MVVRRSAYLCLALCVAGFLALSAGPADAKREPKKKKERDPFAASTGGVFLYSTDAEIKLGKEVREQVLKEYKLYEDAELLAYVRRVGAKLASYADRQNVTYEFFVLDDPLVNAFALPGGTIYITRGILTVFKSEAELAGVLGHEITHIVERHSMKQMQGATLVNLGWQVLGKGQQMPLGYQIGLDLLLFRPYGRGDESRSDALGMKYAYLAGYKADEVAHVFEEFQKRDASHIPAFLRSHPVDSQRISHIQDLWTLIQTRSDIKPSAAALITNLDEYAKIVHPHTYRVFFPQVRAAYEEMLAAVSRKDVEGTMKAVAKDFESKWLKIGNREDLRKSYESLFSACDRVSDTASFIDYRFLGKDAVSARCQVSENRVFSDGRVENRLVDQVVYFQKNAQTDTGVASSWRLARLEEGAKW